MNERVLAGKHAFSGVALYSGFWKASFSKVSQASTSASVRIRVYVDKGEDLASSAAGLVMLVGRGEIHVYAVSEVRRVTCCSRKGADSFKKTSSMLGIATSWQEGDESRIGGRL